MKEQSKVLIIAKPGQVRDGLHAFLRAIPGWMLLIDLATACSTQI